MICELGTTKLFHLYHVSLPKVMYDVAYAYDCNTWVSISELIYCSRTRKQHSTTSYTTITMLVHTDQHISKKVAYVVRHLTLYGCMERV